MISQRISKNMLTMSIATLILFACTTADSTATKSVPIETQATAAPAETLVPESVATLSMPQPFATPASFGPEQEDFPKGYNPLSGQPVEDPSLLRVPAMLMSISHFPPVARPQAGLSFAPWVFEFYITEGATRFLSVFYGEYPKPEIPITGDCEIRKGPFAQTAQILGNQVWLDENKNGRQESYEPGVGGICVNLYEADKLIASTTTDTNGYYGFNVQPAKYTIEFILPKWLDFTTQNVGDENADSDADQLSGRADAEVQSTNLFLDAGLIPSEQQIPALGKLPPAEVGPIRSGRLLYADIAGFFQDSCLVYAFASEEVLSEIPQCAMVVHEDAGGGSMMSLERMQAVAEDNMRHTRGGFNYSSNLFTEKAPKGGVPADQVNVYVALLNQSGWTYDPLYGSWLRFVDDANIATAGQLHPATDRLTGRQLHFENFVVIFTDVDVISSTNLDIHLEQGDLGPALLFRDGKKYEIKWSTKSGEYEKKTGERRPMQFLNPDGSPAQLKPGSTWIFVATPYSVVSDEGNSTWKLRYYAPEGSK